MFESVTDRLQKAERIVFVTGAGISQESGIPTFRGNDGLYSYSSSFNFGDKISLRPAASVKIFIFIIIQQILVLASPLFFQYFLSVVLF